MEPTTTPTTASSANAMPAATNIILDRPVSTATSTFS
jgi:hypothetical protein